MQRIFINQGIQMNMAIGTGENIFCPPLNTDSVYVFIIYVHCDISDNRISESIQCFSQF